MLPISARVRDWLARVGHFGCVLALLLGALVLGALGVGLLGAGAAQAAPSAETENYTFEWSPGLDGFGKALVASAEIHHARIYGELGGDAEGPSRGRTKVFLLPDERAMRADAEARFGHAPPEWADGLAYPTARTIFLHPGKGASSLDVTFQHEISHVALGAVTERENVPRWFSEGLAIRQSEGFAMERAWLLTQAATMDALMDLDRLSRGFPPGSGRAGVAYAQAVHFVGHLEAEFGTDAFRDLIARLRAGEPFADAVDAATGRPLAAIEADWRRDLQIWWGWVPVVFGSTTLWGVGAVLLLLAWRRRRGQRVVRLAQMRAHEAVEMAEDIEVSHGLVPRRELHDPYEGRPPTIH